MFIFNLLVNKIWNNEEDASCFVYIEENVKDYTKNILFHSLHRRDFQKITVKSISSKKKSQLTSSSIQEGGGLQAP